MVPLRSVKINDDVSLEGLEFKVFDQFIGDCSVCGRRHQICELNRRFEINSAGVKYYADQRYMYCTYTDERYLQPGQAEENRDRILNARSADGRLWRAQFAGGVS